MGILESIIEGCEFPAHSEHPRWQQYAVATFYYFIPQMFFALLMSAIMFGVCFLLANWSAKMAASILGLWVLPVAQLGWRIVLTITVASEVWWLPSALVNHNRAIRMAGSLSCIACVALAWFFSGWVVNRFWVL